MPDPYWFKTEPQKELASMFGLSTLAIGARHLLTCRSWSQSPPCSLPADDATLAGFAGLELGVWSGVKGAALEAFTPGTDGRLHNLRLREQWDKASNKANVNALNANKNKGHPRTRGERGANATRSNSNSNSNSVSKNPESGSSGSGVSPPPPDTAIPTLEEATAYAASPQCGFPPAMVQRWLDTKAAQGWHKVADWRASMRSSRDTYRQMEKEQKVKDERSKDNSLGIKRGDWRTAKLKLVKG